MRFSTTTLKAALIATGFFWATAAGAAGITMKLAHSAAPGEPRDLGAHKVADIINASNSCDMKVEVYPSSQLGGSNDMIQLLQLGSVEATLLPASFLVGFQPLLGLMDLPYYLPDDPELLLKVHESDAMQELLDTTEEKGVVSLGVWHTGYKAWTGPKPMISPDDYKGLTARVMPSQVLAEQNELLGLQNVSMNFGETYSALQSGTIQAQDNPITLIDAMKFYEVQDYLTLTDHGTLDQIFMISKAWWDNVPADCQAELEAAVQEGAKISYERTYEDIDKAMEQFSSSKMEVVEMDAEEKAVLAELLKPTRDFYIEFTNNEGKYYLEKFDEVIANLN